MQDGNNNQEKYFTPKGDGDGVQKFTPRKRYPVPSARKFSARAPRDENMKDKLEQTLEEMSFKVKKHNCLVKAQTVAEITPTKSKRKKTYRQCLKLNFDGDAPDLDTTLQVALHATPRPLDGTPALASQAQRRRCTRDWAVCTVYQRLLLFVWRRTKARLQTLSESNGRQQNQISQLELQVDFMNSMRKSECEKRNQALQKCHSMSQEVSVLEITNNNLMQELKIIKEDLLNTKKNLTLTKHDLIKTTDQLSKSKEQAMRRREEKMDLISKLNCTEQQVSCQNEKIVELEEKYKMIENNRHNMESNFKNKQKELEAVQEQYQLEVKLNDSLKDRMASLENTKVELERRVKTLENELMVYIDGIENLEDENIMIRENLAEVTVELFEEKKKKWVKITKELTLLSLSALQKIIEVMLPVYHKY
uniref:Spindle pole body component 110-like isoform X1 n=1 Tax=Diabrotica virgifera virgifera TaxID=50390 RepID=A0A6P7F7G0_DIAVI